MVSEEVAGGAGFFKRFRGGGAEGGRAPGECLWGEGGGYIFFVRGRNAHQEGYGYGIRLGPGEIKASTSTVAALFSKMALTGERIAMVGLVSLVFPAIPNLL